MVSLTEPDKGDLFLLGVVLVEMDGFTFLTEGKSALVLV
jgi:hypothetical protein